MKPVMDGDRDSERFSNCRPSRIRDLKTMISRNSQSHLGVKGFGLAAVILDLVGLSASLSPALQFFSAPNRSGRRHLFDHPLRSLRPANQPRVHARPRSRIEAATGTELRRTSISPSSTSSEKYCLTAHSAMITLHW